VDKGPLVEIILGRLSAELARHCKGSLIPERWNVTVVENSNLHPRDMQFSGKIVVYPENHTKCHVL
jgi:hypothetical protein